MAKKKPTATLHRSNRHRKGYDLALLCDTSPELSAFVRLNPSGRETVDFADPAAVKALNKALLKVHYGIDYWEFANCHLCPPIPGRVDYIHYLKDLIGTSQAKVRILDIGTGATCIYPLLGQAVFGWDFVGSDVEKASLENAQTIIRQNQLEHKISLRRQSDGAHILKGLMRPKERFTAVMCNPPFYRSAQEATEANTRKVLGLGGHEKRRNFSGTDKELWYPGGEKAFVHNYLYESSLFPSHAAWYTTLVSNKDHVKSMQGSLKKLGAVQVKVIPMAQGNKITRIVAWTFLSDLDKA